MVEHRDALTLEILQIRCRWQNETIFQLPFFKDDCFARRLIGKQKLHRLKVSDILFKRNLLSGSDTPVVFHIGMNLWNIAEPFDELVQGLLPKFVITHLSTGTLEVSILFFTTFRAESKTRYSI